MAIQKASDVWVDSNGNTSLRSIRSLTGQSAIVTQMLAYSNAVISEHWEGDDTFTGAVPGVGDYLSVKQLAVLDFTDGAGSSARLILPAPSTSIFNSDGTTVSALAIGPLIAACIGSLVTAAGTTVTAFVGGQLIGGFINGSTS